MTFIIQSQSYRVDHKKAQMQGWISKESIKHTPSPLCLCLRGAASLADRKAGWKNGVEMGGGREE